jgi:pimeloyl-ACP methyl ester carboxylesterase
MRIMTSVAATIFLLSVSIPAECQTSYGSNKKVGKYIEVNDIKVYYEVYGAGDPLLLLHGNSGSIANFVYQIPALSRHFKVVAVDSRGQGQSTDSQKEITYALMASDMSELIDKLNLGSVHVVGWSDGGNIGLELALAHRAKVKKLVAIGANYTHENWMAPPDSVVMEANDPRMTKAIALMKEYKKGMDRLSPVVKKKLNDLMENHPNLIKDQLKTITTPTLIVVGDRDAINMDQTVALFTCLPHSQLFIVPGATHLVPIERSELVNSEMIRFLSRPFRDLDRYYWLSVIQPPTQ